MTAFPNGQNNAAGAIPVYIVAGGGSSGATLLNISAPTVVKAAPGSILTVSVIEAGSAPGTVNDCLTTGAAAEANEVATIPNVVNSYPINFPCMVGIVVVPGTGQKLAVAYQ